MKNVLLLISLAICSISWGQEHHAETTEIHPHQDNIEIYFGDTYNKHLETNFLTIGLDYEYRLRKLDYKLGVSLLMDYEFANFYAPGEEVKRRRSEFLVTPVLNFYPTEKFKVYGGGGMLFTEEHQQLVSRLGIGYEFEIHHRFLIIPSISTDLGKDYIAYLAGVALGIGFH